jgi:AcrR family transcriptional regulator
MARLTRTESREQTRRRLLDAAAELFARNGYQATSVDDVAEAAGYSKGALYYNFESKDELFDALVTQHIGDLTQQLENALVEASTIEEKLAAAQRVLTEREREQKGADFELEVLMQARRDPKLRKTVNAAYQRFRAAISSLIDEQFAAAGAKPPLPADALAIAILAGGLGHGIMQSIDPDAVPPGLLPSVVALLLRP